MQRYFLRTICLPFFLIAVACTYIEIPPEVRDKPIPIEKANDVSGVGLAFAEVESALRMRSSVENTFVTIAPFIFDDQATALNLPIRASNLQSIHSLAELGAVFTQTREQLMQEDPRLAVLFDFVFNSSVADRLVRSIQNTPDRNLRADWSRVTGFYMASAVIAAKELETSQEDIALGNQIATILLNGLQDSDPQTIHQELLQWRNDTEDMVYLAAGQPTPEPTPLRLGSAGTDIKRPLLFGSAERGARLLLQYGCVGCHGIDYSAAGPSFSAKGSRDGLGMAGRAEAVIHADNYQGLASTVDEFLFESIVLPSIYAAEGYPIGIEPPNFGETLDLQDIADIIAYIKSVQ